jgi:DNA-binding IclR family transcriptional regulator
MPRYPTQAPLKSSAETGGVAAVDRALLLLAAFRTGDTALPLADLAERAQLVKSTALRLLASLVHFRLVQRLPDGRYALGPEIARLQGVYTGSFSMEAVVVPALRELVRETRETAVYTCARATRASSSIAWNRRSRSRPRAGRRPDAARARCRGPGDLGVFRREGRDLRPDPQGGLCRARGRSIAGPCGIAAPVFGATGELAGAVTLTMPANRFRKGYAAAVKSAAREITSKLGGTP